MKIYADKIYSKANKLVRQFGTRDPAIISKELGIMVKYGDFGSLLGMYTYAWRHRIILLSNQVDNQLLSVVHAHELGHDQLHRAVAKESAFHEFALFDIRSRMEYEANSFAAHLLIDNNDVLEMVKDGYDIVQMASNFNVNINMMLIKVQEMSKMGFDIRAPWRPDASFLGKVTDFERDQSHWPDT
ncbi:MAG: ImmA/IrrE family metallo-endopeptidase [Christensenellaceae bacterium]|nr:ImmA/IrrE family metallo-endopeptidase [Christensenellaceae bacterium]